MLPPHDGQATVEAPDAEPVILITRTLDAPRELVWRCYTEPKHMVHFWGPHGSTTPVCEVDLRPGGIWRTVMRFGTGNEYGYTSIYLEVVPPERIVYRDAPDGWDASEGEPPPWQIHSTLAFEDDAGRTRMTVTVRFRGISERDDAVKRGFAGMVIQGNERLAEYLKTPGPSQG
jgi:uncharacterized protein YndB with AHSA1/START domain